jgi:hypothetical protein
MSWEIHPHVSVCTTIAHGRSISNNINKRNPKENGHEIDIDREPCRSLKMKQFHCKKWMVQLYIPVSQQRHKQQQSKLAHYIRNYLVDRHIQ